MYLTVVFDIQFGHQEGGTREKWHLVCAREYFRILNNFWKDFFLYI